MKQNYFVQKSKQNSIIPRKGLAPPLYEDQINDQEQSFQQPIGNDSP